MMCMKDNSGPNYFKGDN